MLAKNVKGVKLILLYLFYAVYLRIFYSLFVEIIYYEYPARLNNFFFPFLVERNIFLNILGTIWGNLLVDLFWLLPFTVMNIVVFSQLTRSIFSGNRRLFLNHINSLMLKAYAVWVCIYVIVILFAYAQEGDLYVPNYATYAPFGHLALVYFLLGNFTFFNVVLPLLDSFLRKTKIYEDFQRV